MKDRLLELLEAVRSGALSPEAARTDPRLSPEADLHFAVLDEARALRTGLPEVVYGEGKRVEDLVGVLRHFAAKNRRALVTRVSQAQAEAVRALVPEASYEPIPRLLRLEGPEGTAEPLRVPGPVLVMSAGTSDAPIAEEAARCAEWFGLQVVRAADLGVAGLHRVHARIDRLREARVIIVVAGMEGALPSVVAGLVRAPVIAVPTSVGYGASFGGLAALLAMVNSCAGGVSVVNIDNGFGAALVAWRILAATA